MTRWHRRAGLTLTEVLVAMLLTTVVVLGTWRFFSSASLSMSVFNGLANTDERLAFASDMIVSDARVAGMYGTPYSAEDPLVCPKPVTAIRAVVVEDAYGLPGYDWAENTNITPDRCTFEAPASPNVFHPTSVSANIITLVPSDVAGLAVDDDTFAALFDEHIIRITAPNGFSQFTQVVDSAYDTLQLTVEPTPTTVEETGLCGIDGLGGPDHEITILTFIRYQLMVDPEDDERIVLVREELRPDQTTVVAGSRIAIAENVVDLQCWADEDTGTVEPVFEGDTELGDDEGNADPSETSTATQRLRLFYFQLTGRTDREFENYNFIARPGVDELLTTFDVNGDAGDAALALTVGQSVELSNLMVRGLR